MEIDQEIEKTAFDVVRRYIAAINAGDEEGVRDAFNFPHFRIGLGGRVIHYPDASTNPLANFREKTLTDGWHHSEVDKLEALATFPGKAHIGVHFRRLREDGAPTTRSTLSPKWTATGASRAARGREPRAHQAQKEPQVVSLGRVKVLFLLNIRSGHMVFGSPKACPKNHDLI